MEEQIAPVFKLIVPFYWKMCLIKWKKQKQIPHTNIQKQNIKNKSNIDTTNTHCTWLLTLLARYRHFNEKVPRKFRLLQT
jgi:hypothetical protein